MTRYAIVDAGGDILTVVSCPDGQQDQQAALYGVDCIAIEASEGISDDLHRWNGAAFEPNGWVVGEPEMAIDVRRRRDELLRSSDWRVLPDTPGDSAAWAAYRAALRDIPEQPGFPETVIWPVPPAE